MTQAITTPSLQINGAYIPIVPNSLKITRGAGVKMVKAQANGSSATPVYENDLTEAIGKVEFAIFNTTDNINQMTAIQDLYDSNVVQATQGDYAITMPSATITNDPEYELGADKTTTITMMGAEAV